MRAPELAAVEVHGMTRSAFILRGALAAGAMYGAGAVAPFVSRAFAQTGGGDVEILSFALGLERIEEEFYKQAVKNAKLRPELKELATNFGEQETAHAEALQQTLELLGGQAPGGPKPRFGLSDERTFLRLAVALEDTGVGAYNGAGPAIDTPDVIAAAGSIVQVEARHAAALRMRAGEDPAPVAFDEALTRAQVDAAVKQATGG
jgi:rubrerythrin